MGASSDSAGIPTYTEIIVPLVGSPAAELAVPVARWLGGLLAAPLTLVNQVPSLAHREGAGEAAYIEKTGKAQGAQVEAVGMARAKAYEAQVKALGQTQTAIVNVATVLSEGKAKFVPDVLVAGGGGSLEGLAATLIKHFEPSQDTPALPTKK